MEAKAANEELFPEPEQPVKETKAEAFERVGVRRMATALKAIDLVGNLSNRSTYDYAHEDVEAITATLRQAVGDIESRFRVNSPREPFRFKR